MPPRRRQRGTATASEPAPLRVYWRRVQAGRFRCWPPAISFDGAPSSGWDGSGSNQPSSPNRRSITAAATARSETPAVRLRRPPGWRYPWRMRGPTARRQHGVLPPRPFGKISPIDGLAPWPSATRRLTVFPSPASSAGSPGRASWRRSTTWTTAAEAGDIAGGRVHRLQPVSMPTGTAMTWPNGTAAMELKQRANEENGICALKETTRKARRRETPSQWMDGLRLSTFVGRDPLGQSAGGDNSRPHHVNPVPGTSQSRDRCPANVQRRPRPPRFSPTSPRHRPRPAVHRLPIHPSCEPADPARRWTVVSAFPRNATVLLTARRTHSRR